MKPNRFAADRYAGGRFHTGIRMVGITLTVLASLLWITSVMGKSATPDWVNGPSQKYPAAIYLTGVGHGDTRQVAEDRAYAAISKIFMTEINSKAQEWEKYVQSEVKGQVEDSRQIRIEQATKVSTQKVLENVTIAETYLDDPKAVYYALAVMDRQHATSVLRDRITSLDLKVEELLKQSQTSDNKLRTVQTLHAAVRNLLLREVYNTELRIVNPTGKGSEGMVSLAVVSQKLREFLAKNFKIVVRVDGQHHEQIRAAIVEGLSRQGLPVTLTELDPADPQADLVIKGRVAFEPVELPGRGSEPPLFIRWSAVFELTDPASQQVIGNVAKQGREGHLTTAEAEARALRVSEREVSEEMGRQMAGFIYGEGEQ